MTKGHSAACAPGDDAGDARQPHLRMGSSSKLAPEAARKAHLYDLMLESSVVPGSPRPYGSRKDQPLPKVRNGTESQGPLMHFQAWWASPQWKKRDAAYGRAQMNLPRNPPPAKSMLPCDTQ
jgi:hypothetical protein